MDVISRVTIEGTYRVRIEIVKSGDRYFVDRLFQDPLTGVLARVNIGSERNYDAALKMADHSRRKLYNANKEG